MKVGDLATHPIVAVEPDHSLRHAAQAMTSAEVGSAIVLVDGKLVGIITERDVLHAVADCVDLDGAAVERIMTRDVVTVGPDWEIYEAAAEMAARRIRHLVVSESDSVLGVVSVRDVLLAGQRVDLGHRQWAVLRDPLTFTVRERRRLQRYLLAIRGTHSEDEHIADLVGLLVGSWSFEVSLPPSLADLNGLPEDSFEVLRGVILAELPSYNAPCIQLQAGANAPSTSPVRRDLAVRPPCI